MICSRPEPKRDGHGQEKQRASPRPDPSSSKRPLPPPPPLQPRAPPQPPLLARPRFEPVDREKTCPMLLRVLTKVGSHHNEEDFTVRGKEPQDEVQIFTWKDATL